MMVDINGCPLSKSLGEDIPTPSEAKEDCDSVVAGQCKLVARDEPGY